MTQLCGGIHDTGKSALLNASSGSEPSFALCNAGLYCVRLVDGGGMKKSWRSMNSEVH